MDLSVQGPVARLVIRREDKLNALDAEMLQALLALCREVERSSARVLIVTGAGSRSFCAGGDIAAWSKLSPQEFSRFWVREGHQALDALARLAIPVIAVLNGHCLGGGLELAACADFRIAEAHVKLGQPEAGLGVVAGWSGTQRAARRFGVQTVRRMALGGAVFGAEEALRLGLVDEVVAEGQGMASAEKMVNAIVARSPQATALTKMMINAAEGEESERVIDALAGLAAAGGTDMIEGLAAFGERRSPRFASGSK